MQYVEEPSESTSKEENQDRINTEFLSPNVTQQTISMIKSVNDFDDIITIDKNKLKKMIIDLNLK